MRASKVSKRSTQNSGVRKSRVSLSPSSPTRSNILPKHSQEEFDAVLNGKKEQVKRSKVTPATNSIVKGDKNTALELGESNIYEQYGQLNFAKYVGTCDEIEQDIRTIEENELVKKQQAIKDAEKKISALRKQLDVAETGAEAANKATLPALRKCAEALEYMQMNGIEGLIQGAHRLDDISTVHMLAVLTLLDAKAPYHLHSKEHMHNGKKKFIFMKDGQNKCQ